MKPQDILFILVAAGLLFTRKQKLFLYAGILCLLASVPLFAKWIFFTAERLTWYAAAFFFVYLLGFFFSRDTVK